MRSNLISTIGIIVCSFTGSAFALTELTLVKEVVGGEATATDWVLTADGTDANDLSGAGWVQGLVDPDIFELSESVGPPGYTAGDWDCVGGGTQDGHYIHLSTGDVVTCTIINTFVPPVVIFDSDFALPSMPVGDGTGTPVCVDDTSGLLVAGCEVTITADQIDPTTVQKRVDGACAVGYLVRAINEDGSVVCEPDTDTVLSEAQVDAFVADNGYSTGPHTVDTTLNEVQVDAYVADNGYLTIEEGDSRWGQHPITVTSAASSANYLGNSMSACNTDTDHKVSITVPAAGTILLRGSVWVKWNHTAGTNDQMVLYFTPLTSGCTLTDFGGWDEMWVKDIPSSFPTDTSIYDMANIQRTVTVDAADTYTFYLGGYMASGYTTETDYIWWTNISATWHPN